MENRIALHGSDSEKPIMALFYEFQKLANFISKISPENLQDFFVEIPKEIHNMIDGEAVDLKERPLENILEEALAKLGKE